MTYLSRHRKRHNVRGIFNQRCGVPSCFARPCNDGFPADESLRNFVMQSVSTSGWQFACPAARLARPHPLPSTPLSFHPPSLTLPLPRSPRCKLNCTQNIRLPSSGKGNTGPAPNTSALFPSKSFVVPQPVFASGSLLEERSWRPFPDSLKSSDLKRERRPNVRYLRIRVEVNRILPTIFTNKLFLLVYK